MDGEMVHVSTDAGKGATGLQTWQLAHTEDEAAELARSTMTDGGSILENKEVSEVKTR